MIYFLRHGLDDERYIGGWSEVDLVEKGRDQIVDVVQFIKKNNLCIDKIYCSDIKRTVSSAEIVGESLNLIPISTSILRELNKGNLNGLLIEEVQKKYPYEKNITDINHQYPNGESVLELYKRIKRDLDIMLEKDNSLLITHRGVINMIYFILNDIPINLNKEYFSVEHGSLHEYNQLTKKIKRIY